MEGVMRKRFQGVANIIRFNWHFYVIAIIAVLVLLAAAGNFTGNMASWSCVALAIGIVASVSISLLVSYYVYDQSGLYNFMWLHQLNKENIGNIVNIHAGFDETSSILETAFPNTTLHVFDFYNPLSHTEISIERARKAYPSYNGTVEITTEELPLSKNSVDIIFNIFALHEVRDRNERVHFLKQQAKTLRHGGKLVVVEHLRDIPNFLAYNIGFFHFISSQEWNANFRQAGLCMDHVFKITSFITVFILKKADGNTP